MKPSSPSLANRFGLAAVYAIMAVVLYVLLAGFAWNGDYIWAPIAAIVVSPVIFTGIRKAELGRSFRYVIARVFSHRRQSHAFLYGDLIMLPFAFATVAHAYATTDAGWLNLPTWWILVSGFVGLLGGALFHFALEAPAYTEAGYRAELKSPSKIYHDFVVYPVLLGSLLCTGGRLLRIEEHGLAFWRWNYSAHVWVVLACVAVWGILGTVVDGRRAKYLIPWGHVPVPMFR